MRPRLAVIIPTLNERQTLPALVSDLHAQQGIDLQCWISDGGSTDGTLDWARDQGLAVCRGSVGRGAQMNRGHRAAQAPWRLFLHADSRLPRPDLLAGAIDHLRQHDPRRTAGHWPVHFHDAPAQHRRLFQFMEAKTRSGRPGTIHGDQGLLIHRDFFEALGGYDETLPWFEDVRLSEQVFRQGRWTLLPGALHTSARRFVREGVRRRYLLMGLMMSLDAVGDVEALRSAPALYRSQAAADALAVAPLLRLAGRRLLLRPRVWPALLHYGWTQRWQLALAGRQRLSSAGHLDLL